MDLNQPTITDAFDAVIKRQSLGAPLSTKKVLDKKKEKTVDNSDVKKKSKAKSASFKPTKLKLETLSEVCAETVAIKV